MDLDASAVIVALVGVMGTLPAVLNARRTERDKLTETRVMDMLDRQDEDLAGYRAEVASLKQEMAGKDAENQQVWELFSLAIEQVSEWLRWDMEGRVGDPPELPRRLREHLPRDVSARRAAE